MFQTSLDTPIGTLLIEGTRSSVTSVRIAPANTPTGKSCALLNQARRQLREYFRGRRAAFDLPLDLSLGTAFQRQVWQVVASVGLGETITYAEIARRVRRPTATRAVGRAVARNPFMIVIPCHRVLSSKGKLTGYAGGLAAKEWLLKHEQAVLL